MNEAVSPLQKARAQVWGLKHGYVTPTEGSLEENLALWERRLADIVNYPVRMAVKAAIRGEA